MNIFKLISTTLLTLTLVAPLSACDGDDEESTETAVETTAEETTGDSGPSEDITCAIFCVEYITSCLGTEGGFETDMQCQEACADWDQAGANCRYEQMVGGMCDMAGDTTDAC